MTSYKVYSFPYEIDEPGRRKRQVFVVVATNYEIAEAAFNTNTRIFQAVAMYGFKRIDAVASIEVDKIIAELPLPH